MLESKPFFFTMPTSPWQTDPSSHRLADFTLPMNGLDPTVPGWVYVKVDVWSGICKVGYTDGALASRLTETGNPNLIVHRAYWVPGGPGEPYRAEQHCHGCLNPMNRAPHLMTGERSEFIRGGVEHITGLVERAMQLFYDDAARSVGRRWSVSETRYCPQYHSAAVRHNSDIRAAYWARYFGLEKLYDPDRPPPSSF
jgi:hypothetical protein